MKHKLFLILAALGLLMPQAAFAYDFKVDGIYYNISGSNAEVTYETTSYKSYSGSVVIPSTVTYEGTTYSVTSIGDYAFSGCSGLTSITIPNSVTRIGSHAFDGCTGLTSVTIPNSVTSIGSDAFDSCSGLASVTIPNSVTSIGIFAFSGCTSLPVINNIRYADSYAIEVVDKSLATYVIKEGTRFIGNYAFSGCSGLTSITIPNSVTCIGDYAFSGCSGLISVTIPNSVKSIGMEAFYGCSGLTSINIGNGVTRIMRDAFLDCAGLTSVSVEEGNTHYDSRNDCNAIIETLSNTLIQGCKNTIIPDGVTSIGIDAFFGCSGLTSVTIPSSVTSIGDEAFGCCSGLTSITIPNSVTSIGDGAFYNCTGLTSVAIPNGVTSIGNCAFYKCSGLTSITIPNSVTSIGYEAFNGCRGLTSVTIGNGVTEIGRDAFKGCSGVKELIYADGCTTTLVTHLTSITSVYIPNSVTSIKSYAFDGFNKLSSVKITDLKAWCSISGLYNLMNNVTAKKLYLNDEEITHLIIPEDISSITGSAFYNCYFTSITIPNSVTSIGTHAFSGCEYLSYDTDALNECLETMGGFKTLVIGDNVTEIKDNAFYVEDSSELTSITIGSGVKRIGSSAFGDCGNVEYLAYDTDAMNDIMYCGNPFYNVKTVIVGNNVTSIGDYAFPGCIGLTSITIGNSVTSIGDGAFFYCSGLTSITIPGSVTSIGEMAFFDCSDLTSVTNLSSTPQTILSDVFSEYGTLHVPKGCKSAYEAADYWKNFTIVDDVILLADGDNFTVDGINYSKSGSEVSVISGSTKYSGSVVIPSSVTYGNVTYNVTSIGDHAFSGCSGLTSVTIPNSVTSIGEAAFCGCSGLTSVTIPEGVISIGGSAFAICSSLTSVTIPEGVPSIEHETFRDCTGLNSVTIPNSVTSIGGGAFAVCSGLTSITIPNGVESIEINAFQNCYDLTSVTVEEGNTKYDSRENCNAIIETTSNTLIMGCKNTIIPNSVTSIGECAFNGCSGLTSITIPNSVTSIGDGAFYECTGLTSIINCAAVPQTIGDEPFWAIPSDAILYVPKGCKEAYAAVDYWRDFSIEELNTIKLNQLYGFSTPTRGAWTMVDTTLKGTSQSGVSETVDENNVNQQFALYQYEGQIYLWSQSAQHFLNNNGQAVPIYNASPVAWTAEEGDTFFFHFTDAANKYINLGGNYQITIDGWSDADAGNKMTLTPVEGFDPAVVQAVIAGDIPPVSVVLNNVAYNLDVSTKTATILGASSKNITSAEIVMEIEYNEDTYTVSPSIPNNAFSDCTSLTSVIIPEGITSIGEQAFYECSNLSSTTFPSSLTSIGIEAYARTAITTVTIPRALTDVGECAFNDCSQIAIMEVEEGNEVYDSRNGCNAIIRTSDNTLVAAGNNAFIPEGIQAIARHAFTYRTGLAHLNIPGSVVRIGDSAFWGADIEIARLPEGLTELAQGTFSTCNRLSTVFLPSTITNISNWCFDTCPHLKTVISYTEELPHLGEYNFHANTLYVPAGCKELYLADTMWSQSFNEIEEFQKEVVVTATPSSEDMGTVTGGGTYNFGESVTLTTTPAEGTRFIHWSNGSVANPYTFVALSDTILTAVFVEERAANISTKYYTAPQLRAEADNGTALIGILNVTSTGDKFINGALQISRASSNGTLAGVRAPESVEVMEVIPADGGYYLRQHAAEAGMGYFSCVANGNISLTNKADATVWTILGPDEEGYGDITGYNNLYTDIAAEPNEHMIRFIAHGQYLNGEGYSYNCGLRPGIGSWSFNYAYNANYSSFIINDAEEYTATEAQTVGELTYTRNFKNTNWQALYIPFSLDYEEWCDDFDIAKIHNFIEYDDDENGEFDRTYLVVLKKNSGSTKANYPYLIRAKETGVKTLTLVNKTLEPAEINSVECGSTVNIYTFTGSYTPVTDMYANGYYALSGGALNKANSASVVLGAQRWYMDITPRATEYGSGTKAQSIKIVVDGEDETEAIEAPSCSSKGETPVAYDLMGRGVKGAVKGISIVNGKKIIK